jgi:hypothetical protein
MRRLLPWVLVSLVAVAGLVGALVGVANQPHAPSAHLRLSAIIAATRSAGTARFTYSSITTSSNPFLRSHSEGEGAVDFRTGSISTVERDTSTNVAQNGNGPVRPFVQTQVVRQVWVGRSYYTQFNDVGDPQFADVWVKGEFPAGSSGALGVLDQIGPLGVLDGEVDLSGTRVDRLGPGDRTATRYRVVIPTCAKPPPSDKPRVVFGPVLLWLDGDGRLSRVRVVLHQTDSVGSFAHGSITVSTIRFADFGGLVAIATPHDVATRGESAIAILSTPKRCQG